MITRIFCLITMIFSLVPVFSQQHRVYFLPGQGADARAFSGIELPPGFEAVMLTLPVPEPGADMAAYARQIRPMIDDSQPFSLVGVSLGGMVAIELSKLLKPTRVVLIASAKQRKELPLHLQLLRFLPVHRLIPGHWYIKLGNVFRPIFEPEGRAYHDLSTRMLNDKHPDYLQRAIDCIVTWDNEEVPENVFHIHGTKDHTLPYRRVQAAIPVPSGSHMLILTQKERVNQLLAQALRELAPPATAAE